MPVDPDAVRYVDGDDARDHLAGVWDRYRRTRAGEISRDAVWHDSLQVERERGVDGFSGTHHLAHRDGHAAYRIKERWNGSPENTMEIVELASVTAQAHLDLWHVLLGIDLVTSIKVKNLPSDDALPYLLTEVRPFRTTLMKDGFWSNVLDPAVAFGARAFGTADRLVVEADGVRWAIESDGDESSCRRVRTRPDLVTDGPSLGALLFGGVRPSMLERGRRLSARNADVLRRGDAFFVVGSAPHCSTWF